MVRQRTVKTRHIPDPGSTATAAKASEMAAGNDEPRQNTLNQRTQWIFYAVASGACAAFNGVFAKLTTTELTSSLSNAIAIALGLSSSEKIVEYVVRGLFFALNLIFNGVMWTLFTQALAKGTSTTQVSIMNTSTNFMLTALLGLFIFGESLSPMWWAGASLLVAGNVIVGRKDEGKAEAGPYEPVSQDIRDGELERDARHEDEDVIDLGEATDERR